MKKFFENPDPKAQKWPHPVHLTPETRQTRQTGYNCDGAPRVIKECPRVPFEATPEFGSKKYEAIFSQKQRHLGAGNTLRPTTARSSHAL